MPKAKHSQALTLPSVLLCCSGIMAEQSRDANVPDRQGALIASKAPGSNQDAADFRADGAAKAEYQKRSFRANLLDRIQPIQSLIEQEHLPVM